MIDISDAFFPQLSNGVDSFPKKFHFHLQKVQNVLYLKKCIFNMFFDPLDRKLSIFYVRKDIFQRVPEMFSARNRMRKRRRTAFSARGTRCNARTAPASLPVYNNLL